MRYGIAIERAEGVGLVVGPSVRVRVSSVTSRPSSVTRPPSAPVNSVHGACRWVSLPGETCKIPVSTSVNPCSSNHALTARVTDSNGVQITSAEVDVGYTMEKGKRVIGLMFGPPQGLTADELARFTTVYALYGKTPPFVEVAVRALAGEAVPTGHPSTWAPTAATVPDHSWPSRIG